jgi:hypothetical protein
MPVSFALATFAAANSVITALQLWAWPRMHATYTSGHTARCYTLPHIYACAALSPRVLVSHVDSVLVFSCRYSCSRVRA